MTEQQRQRLWDFLTALLFPQREPRDLELPAPPPKAPEGHDGTRAA